MIGCFPIKEGLLVVVEVGLLVETRSRLRQLCFRLRFMAQILSRFLLLYSELQAMVLIQFIPLQFYSVSLFLMPHALSLDSR